MDTLTIVSLVTGAFWSGKRWVAEYPAAKVYGSKAAALAACKLLNDAGELAEVVNSYGTAGERRVY
jgi:hypothetical protein